MLLMLLLMMMSGPLVNGQSGTGSGDSGSGDSGSAEEGSGSGDASPPPPGAPPPSPASPFPSPPPAGPGEEYQPMTVLSFTVTFQDAAACAAFDVGKLATALKCFQPSCVLVKTCSAGTGRRLSGGDRRRLTSTATFEALFPLAARQAAGTVMYEIDGLTTHGLSQLWGVVVIAVGPRTTTTEVRAAPTYTAAPPPPPPTYVCSSCKNYFNGAQKGSNYLCLKPGELSCYPIDWHGGCGNGLVKCVDASITVPVTSIHYSGTPSDKAGIWADKKCGKKRAKGKCFKKRVQRFCGLTCRGQAQRG